ncbi:hypothetical protein PIB30_025103 [Stylosanthes scabra]|uniref:PUM-HD domain-containing protein n=1 Tax=Stylosanthes scabra TaxID=79078 RepID=A0ABU6V860_9FABA|nr:hypothetical protein [Stylosanthes scabra]
MASSNYPLYPILQRRRSSSSSSSSGRLNINPAVEDLDSAMRGLSLSIMPQGNSLAATASNVDPHAAILTHPTMEEVSSEYWNNHHVLNNHNDNARAIVQGAPLASSHDSYYGFSRIEQETNDDDVGEFSVSPTLEGVRGHVATLAMDQCGCRFLQTMVDVGSPEEVEMILDEVIAHTHELMTHHFGNYLIEKIFTSRNLTTHQMERILSSVTRDQQQLMISCMNDHGTRVAQKMLLNLRNPGQVADTMSALEGITVPLLKNANGGYVIQQCVKLFTPCQKYLVKRNTVEPPVIEMIIWQLRGCYAELSMNRHGSHVIEVLFKHSEPASADIIIMELVNSPDFVYFLQDPYGNYVAQRALEYSTGSVHRTLVNKVFSNYAYLHAHPYGKRVLKFIRGINQSV